MLRRLLRLWHWFRTPSAPEGVDPKFWQRSFDAHREQVRSSAILNSGSHRWVS